MEQLRATDRPTLLIADAVQEPARVAMLPGSFDPITVAHAALAEASASWADLTILVYSVRTIAKGGDVEPPLLDEVARIRSLEAFAHAKPGVVVGLCSHGLLVDQVRAARELFEAADLRLAIGSDKLVQLLDPGWYEDAEAALGALFAHAEVSYALREGHRALVAEALSDPRITRFGGRVRRLDVSPALASVSSSLVRTLHRDGQDVADLVPPEAISFLPHV